MNRQIVFVVGSNRTGTSLLTQRLQQLGVQLPSDLTNDSEEYPTYESAEFKALSRKWNRQRANSFIQSLPEGSIVLKYPKASYCIRRWLKIVPDARVIYVFRPREEAVQSQLNHWWRNRPFRFVARWIYRWQWLRGYLAVSNLPAPVWITTFAALKSQQELQLPRGFLDVGVPANEPASSS